MLFSDVAKPLLYTVPYTCRFQKYIPGKEFQSWCFFFQYRKLYVRPNNTETFVQFFKCPIQILKDVY